MIDKRLINEAKKVRLYLILTILLGLITGMVVVFQAKVFAWVVNSVFLLGSKLEEVWTPLLALLGLIIFRAVLTWLSEVYAHRVASKIKEALRIELLQHLFALGPLYVREERTGELVNLLVDGIEALEDYFSRYIPQLILAAIIPLMILMVVFPLDITSGIILLLTAPLIPVFMILIGKWADHLTKRQWDSLSRMSAHFLDVLQGLTTLKQFGRSKDQSRVIERISDDYRTSTLGVLRIAFLSALVLELLATISTALVAVALGLRLVYDRIPFAEAFFLLLLAPEFYMPLRLLGTQFHAGMAGVNVANRIYEVFEKALPRVEYTQERWEFNQKPLNISFRKVHFAYKDDENWALRGVSFDLKPGQRVALVGPSGAGKSTVANLLLKLMEPSKGTIFVNGVSLQKIHPEDWLGQIAYVPQHPYLFYGSVADNIRLGKPDATLEEVIIAAKQAGAHEFIKDFAQGYDTPVGEAGVRLSGGQAQRIAIARAFLKNAQLLILDEATAGLDPGNELQVQRVLQRLMEGRTVLVIAHRLATVYQADSIIVLADGKVVEQGKHNELMQQQGYYFRLVDAYRGYTL